MTGPELYAFINEHNIDVYDFQTDLLYNVLVQLVDQPDRFCVSLEHTDETEEAQYAVRWDFEDVYDEFSLSDPNDTRHLNFIVCKNIGIHTI